MRSFLPAKKKKKGEPEEEIASFLHPLAAHPPHTPRSPIPAGSALVSRHDEHKQQMAAHHHLILKPSGHSPALRAGPGCASWARHQQQPRDVHPVDVATCHPPAGSLLESAPWAALGAPSLWPSWGSAQENAWGGGTAVASGFLLAAAPSPWRNLRLVLWTPGGAGKMI